MIDKMSQGMKSAMQAAEAVQGYSSTINARLKGTDVTFNKIGDMLKRNLGMSPFVEQTKVMQKIEQAVSSGISYNVQERAFLQTISDDIQNTFDAFDASLTRIVRLQQQDSTEARLGLEMTLNEMLNEWVEDTSYLNDAFDQVSAALVEASSLMTKSQSIDLKAKCKNGWVLYIQLVCQVVLFKRLQQELDI